jgi:arabinofuranan 3-O-arabinosyltransferase
VIPAFHADAHDMHPWWYAAGAWLHDSPLYTQIGGLVYPPSALLVLTPFGMLSFDKAKLVFLIVNVAAILLGTALSLASFRVPRYIGAGVIALLGLASAHPVLQTIDLGNINGVIFASEVAMLLAALRGRWLLAGTFLGLGLAIKPVLPALLLLFLFERRYLGLAAAIAIPAILCLPPLVLNHSTAEFFTYTIPFLLSGNDPDIASFNVALAAAVPNLNVPSSVVSVLRITILFAGIILLWLRWRQQDEDPALRLIEITGLLLIISFLCSSFTWRSYGIYLIPLIVSTVRHGALMRNPIAWAGIYCVFTLDVWTSQRLDSVTNAWLGMQPTLGFLLIQAALGIGIVGRAQQLAKYSAAPGRVAV